MPIPMDVVSPLQKIQRLKEKALGGNLAARIKLGYIYLTGDGVSKNTTLAEIEFLNVLKAFLKNPGLTVVNQTALQHLVVAFFQLYFMYKDPNAQSYLISRKLRDTSFLEEIFKINKEKILTLGTSSLCYQLACVFEYNDDLVQASECFNAAINRFGSKRAMIALAKIYADQNNSEKSIELYEQADCDEGRYELGKIFESWFQKIKIDAAKTTKAIADETATLVSLKKIRAARIATEKKTKESQFFLGGGFLRRQVVLRIIYIMIFISNNGLRTMKPRGPSCLSNYKRIIMMHCHYIKQ